MIKGTMLTVLVLAALGIGYVFSGLYPIGADKPHNRATYQLLEILRERSIARSASDIIVPDLTSVDLLLAGGPDYNDMCVVCHLKPGMTESDMSIGLYPTPPNLTISNNYAGSINPETAAKRNYWIIKHGIKASGMPAWGPTHDDERIWAMVAFLQRLPELTGDQYQILTTRLRSGDGTHH